MNRRKPGSDASDHEEITVRKLGTSANTEKSPPGRTMSSNTIKFSQVPPPWPGVGEGGRGFN